MKIEIGLKGSTNPLLIEAEINEMEIKNFFNSCEESTLTLKTKDDITYIFPKNAIAYLRLGEPKQHRVGFGL